MDEQREALGSRAPREGAIDIDDFVYAATGARVRRLTMPDGDHWFPAVDVATELGYANTRQALATHVSREHSTRLEDLARSVRGSDALREIAGHGLKKSMRMVNLRGLVALVGGCAKPTAQPFKRWMVDVIVTVQRDGSYVLDKAEVQPASPRASAAYAMPKEVADAIVRLERHTADSDEKLAATQEDAHRARWETVNVLRTVGEAQERSVMAMRDVMVDFARSMSRLADSVEDLVDKLPPRPDAPPATPDTPRAPRVPCQRGPRLSAEQLLTAWRTRLTITDDVWAVAVVLAPTLAERGEVRLGVATIAARTGLTAARVHDGLRFLLKRQCIRQIGTVHNTPVYGLHHA
ncbi:BRO-N domain-containing protein [Streptomyces sp. NBC_01803]|uniref:BRO-N domain-containing protein n=1 Tax=Streptomyces sp. NBC_01803 TaxID=2975946 RepID=UPI002DD8D802|nr:Bro-N domain-containing protein [Streptomyces sp. NBC_01803]WSA45248.1 Bro-N domain-containing protein [Streptomyces sp. NBC_01803]